ncbi:hypothetical protein QMG61_10670 [Cryobacterium sp. PH31-AA6]|uniref:hypothetical protein n=1 Tax=Cryobacterium sp. PH31-AA6 TaxID=3046205 RepID=UPI0024B8B373|nr:hypothetical protein [Cryobacterium sp. PH31-AA6]MDJ0324228.1 hypothetical protein [Cryobacterium sp. PH31-AA6]
MITTHITPRDVGVAYAQKSGKITAPAPRLGRPPTGHSGHTAAQKTKELIDLMIDRAQEDNLLATYIILVGHTPRSSLAHDDLAWLGGHKTYRRFKIAQSAQVPAEAILLSPTADNYLLGEVTEYTGRIGSHDIGRHTLYA